MKEKLTKKIIKFLKHPLGIISYLFLMVFITFISLNLNFILGMTSFACVAVGTLVFFNILDYLDEKYKKETLKEEYEIIENETKDISKEKQKALENILDSRLNDIKREKEELKKLKEILNYKDDLINITNVYVLEHDGFKYIVDLKENSLKGSILAVRIDFCDIFSNNILNTKYGKYIEQIRNYPYLENNMKITKIEKVEPALLAYPSKLVPKNILQEIYYNINNIDISAPILKKIKNHNKK